MANTTDELDAAAAAAETPRAPRVETPTPRRRGLVVGGMIAGGALAGALLFGGGVLLGANLHGHERHPDFAQGQAQLNQGGRPPMQQQGQRDDRQRPVAPQNAPEQEAPNLDAPDQDAPEQDAPEQDAN